MEVLLGGLQIWVFFNTSYEDLYHRAKLLQKFLVVFGI